MKKSCIYIDQRFHEKTGSTEFLLKVLEERFNVTRYFMDGFASADILKLRQLSADLFVIFQYDVLAPILLADGKKVLVVPMYDGTGEIVHEHWSLFKNALILNFSRRLQNYHLILGLDAHYVQAFPKPITDNSSVTYDSPKYFFWERKPQTGISSSWLVQQLIQHPVPPTLVHFHLSPDPGQYPTMHPDALISALYPMKVTTSSWFSSRSKLTAAMTKCSIYVAPRPVEGIGWSFLEAMSLGMVVLAKNSATMNEYISNWVNGILIDNQVPMLSAPTIRQIGLAARDYISDGYKAWLKQHTTIAELAYEYACRAPKPADYSYEDVFELPRLFFWSHHEYAMSLLKLESRLNVSSTKAKKAVDNLTTYILSKPNLYAYATAIKSRLSGQ